MGDRIQGANISEALGSDRKTGTCAAMCGILTGCDLGNKSVPYIDGALGGRHLDGSWGKYDVYIYRNGEMRIGCHRMLISDWERLAPREGLSIGGKDGWLWWERHREHILHLARELFEDR